MAARNVRRRPNRALRQAISAVVVAATVAGLGACGGGGSDGAKGCDDPVQEQLDPRSVQMVLPNAAEPAYDSDPPTSGVHLMSPGVKGVQDHQLTKPVQVGALETGAVLVQHHGLTADERDQLEDLAGDLIVVAPNDDLPKGDAVVATAWRWKMTCTTVDTPALREFIAQHLGDGSQMTTGG